MRWLPRSLHGRLLALSLLATLAALGVAGVVIGGVLERFMTGALDERLADKLSVLGGAIRKDGSVDDAYVARFDTLAARDAAWRIEAPAGVVGSAMIGGVLGISSAGDQQLGPIAGYRSPRLLRGPAFDPLAPHPFEARLRTGERVHGRWETVPTDRGPARIAVAVSRDAIDRPLLGAMAPLILSLLALGAALVLAAAVQLRLGLRPLRALRDQVAAIRGGRAETVPADQPSELAPLAAELNALAADNRAALAAARGSAANLAHGLKTPVATLRLALGERGRDPHGALAAQVARIDATIRHHLARARAEAIDRRAATALAPAADGLAAAVRRLHPATIAVDVPAGLTVAVDPHDLDEMLGNLLDNAARFARRAVQVAARAEGRLIRVTIADDGPGIPADARAAATRPGARLDERGDGHGFGLAITRELARLYGGELTLDEAPGGGLSASLSLPANG